MIMVYLWAYSQRAKWLMVPFAVGTLDHCTNRWAPRCPCVSLLLMKHLPSYEERQVLALVRIAPLATARQSVFSLKNYYFSPLVCNTFKHFFPECSFCVIDACFVIYNQNVYYWIKYCLHSVMGQVLQARSCEPVSECPLSAKLCGKECEQFQGGEDKSPAFRNLTIWLGSGTGTGLARCTAESRSRCEFRCDSASWPEEQKHWTVGPMWRLNSFSFVYAGLWAAGQIHSVIS